MSAVLAGLDVAPRGKPGTIDVSIVMPCLNEADSLAFCIANARQAIETLNARFGYSAEIVIADNGSSDGSQAIAQRLGAKLVHVEEKGYGAAISAGCAAAAGRFLLMGDADGSYDFRDGVAMIGKLSDGADVCMGSRFKGGIRPGAMPWKNRHIGNPVLTGVLNLFFQAGIDDAHCGIRAFTRASFDRLKLSGTGMEFASEMIIKAALLELRIDEVPATLSKDLRQRPPHLRPWRDGWRHLRYLMMLSPSWLFAFPATFLFFLGASILGITAAVRIFTPEWTGFYFGNYWTILAGTLVEIGHISAIFALACYLYGIREGYRRADRRAVLLSRWISLETMLTAGLVSALTGIGVLIAVIVYWSAHHFAAIDNVLPAVIGTSMFAVGVQNMFGGFLLSVVGGNEANFFGVPAKQAAVDESARRASVAPGSASAASGS
jgi:glycosyltransferase involved in cell wall biosynthesis